MERNVSKREVPYSGELGLQVDAQEIRVFYGRRLIEKTWRIHGIGENIGATILVCKSPCYNQYTYRVDFNEQNESGRYIGSAFGEGTLNWIKRLINFVITNGTEMENHGGDYNPLWYERVLSEF